MDQPGSCQRALCECDLQLVKDLVSESNTWSKKNHQFYGFDLDDGCKADSAGMAGRSSILFFQNNFNNFITLTHIMIINIFADSLRKMKKPGIHGPFESQSQTRPLTVTLK